MNISLFNVHDGEERSCPKVEESLVHKHGTECTPV